MKRPVMRNLKIYPYSGPTQDPSGEILAPEEPGEGKMTFVMEDPEGFAPPLAIPTEMAVLITLFDGQHTLPEIVADFEELVGDKLDERELAEIVGHFDRLHFLDSPDFQAFLHAEIESFRSLPTRPAMMAGGAYEKNPHLLRLQLENCMALPEKIRQAEFPSSAAVPEGRGGDSTEDSETAAGNVAQRSDRITPPNDSPLLSGHCASAPFPAAVSPEGNSIRAIITPHIDPLRGAASYGWAYEALATRNDSELFIILGTAHNPMKQPFALTAKSFETPLGLLATDETFARRLAERYQEKYEELQKETLPAAEDRSVPESVNAWADEFQHRDEHSIEFQAIFLQHALVNEKKRNIRIVPILMNSFLRFFEAEKAEAPPEIGSRRPPGSGESHDTPENSPEIRAMTESLAELIQEEEAKTGKKVGIIVAVDFSHVGPRYGMPDPVNAEIQDRLKIEDSRLFSLIMKGDTAGFWREIIREGDKNNVCGIAPVFCFMELMKKLGTRTEGTGKVLCYEQAVDEETHSGVTFAAMTF